MTSRYSVHPQAICETESLGAGSRVDAFAEVLAGATIGRETEIGSHVRVEGDVAIGDRVRVESGAQLRGGLQIENEVFIGTHVAFVPDPDPRHRGASSAEPTPTRVCQGASIGANATVLPGMVIGRNAVVGAGAVVTRSVPPNAVVVGNPARIKGYAGSSSRQVDPGASRMLSEDFEGARASVVSGVSFHRLPVKRDLRGSLSVGEFTREIPFSPKRYFLVFDVPGSEIRGEHAHRTCHLFLVCVRGSISVVVDDGERREEFLLDHPGLGVHLPPMVWGTQYKHTDDAVLLVFASDFYEASDYIRDYQEFLDEVGRTGS